MRFLKRLFCKHNKTIHVGDYLEKCGEGRYVTRHIWRCKDCGKEFWGK